MDIQKAIANGLDRFRKDHQDDSGEKRQSTAGEAMTPAERITFYGVNWCGDCRRARQVFEKRGIEYDFIDIGEDITAARLVEQINRGNRSVPTILFPDGEILVEPATAALEHKLSSL